MSPPESEGKTSSAGGASWAAKESLWGGATSWNLIEQARGHEGGEARNEAWRTLVRLYGHPITVGLRRRLPAHLVEDGVSSFFSYLYEKQLIDRADPERGRFRCFIQGIMRRWALHYIRAEATRQGPSLEDVVVPGRGEEARIEAEEDSDWASHLLQRALDALRRERDSDVVLLARAYGLTSAEIRTRAQLAAESGITVNALNVRIHHARRRLRESIDAEIHHICRGPGAWQDERRFLLHRLREAHPRLILDLDEGAPKK